MGDFHLWALQVCAVSIEEVGYFVGLFEQINWVEIKLGFSFTKILVRVVEVESFEFRGWSLDEDDVQILGSWFSSW